MKYIKFAFVILVVMILFRGCLFRTMISYSIIGERSLIEISDPDLIARIEDLTPSKELSLKDIAHISNELTNELLYFRTRSTLWNPNQLVTTKTSNCIGYSAMFNSIANHLIKSRHLEKKYASKHCIGKLYWFGKDVHDWFDDPFYKDHDFNQLVDLYTGEIVSTDPSVSDYLWIRQVSLKTTPL